MIQVKLLGGLGNQLFQLAYAIDIANKTQEDIILDVSVYKKYKVREFSLQHFKIFSKCKLVDDNKYGIRLGFFTYRAYQKLMKIIRVTDRYGKWPFYFLSKFGFYYNFDQNFYSLDYKKNNKILYGYFQSEKYFLSAKKTIHEMFKVETELTEVEKNYRDSFHSSNALAISMRLGSDYYNCKDLNVCDSEYYHSAIRKFINKYSNTNICFFVFSDEIEKAEEILKVYHDIDIYFVVGLTDYQSLRFMSLFDKFIIPNSSFSWWGAYLSNSTNKEIICPNKWFNNINDDSDIYTSEMIKLKDYK